MLGLQNILAVRSSLQYFSVFWRKYGKPGFLLISWHFLVTWLGWWMRQLWLIWFEWIFWDLDLKVSQCRLISQVEQNWAAILQESPDSCCWEVTQEPAPSLFLHLFSFSWLLHLPLLAAPWQSLAAELPCPCVLVCWDLLSGFLCCLLNLIHTSKSSALASAEPFCCPWPQEQQTAADDELHVNEQCNLALLSKLVPSTL